MAYWYVDRCANMDMHSHKCEYKQLYYMYVVYIISECDIYYKYTKLNGNWNRLQRDIILLKILSVLKSN